MVSLLVAVLTDEFVQRRESKTLAETGYVAIVSWMCGCKQREGGGEAESRRLHGRCKLHRVDAAADD